MLAWGWSLCQGVKALNKPVFHLIRPRGLLARRCPPFPGPELAARHPHHWPCFNKAAGIHIQPARKRRKLAAPFRQSNLDSSQRRLKRTRGEFRREEGGGCYCSKKEGSSDSLTCVFDAQVFERLGHQQQSLPDTLGCSEMLQLGSLCFYFITFPGHFFMSHSPPPPAGFAERHQTHAHAPSLHSSPTDERA